MKLRLFYFDARGRAELTRLILAYGKLEYEDIRIQGPDWPALKATFPFGFMPVLEVDGVHIGQTIAINSFLARKTGLTGANDVEYAQAEALVDFIKDFMTDLSKIRSATTDEEKMAILDEKAPAFFKRLESKLKKNGGQFLVGKALTYADIALAHIVGVIDGVGPGAVELVAQYPLIAKHKEAIYNLDGIKEWLAKRPHNAF